MKKYLFLALLFPVIFLINCIPTHKHFTVDLKINPETIESGQPTELIFQVKNPQGEKVSDLEIIHEKPMHLFMVSRDLSQYFHEHPEKQADGTYKLPFTFPNGGKFKIYIDFKPVGDEQTVESFNIEAKGEELPEIQLVRDEKFEKEVEGVLVKMKPNGELVKRKDLMLNFQFFDAESKKPLTDLQDYLGEKAHFVIVRKGLGRFIHAHPMSAETMAENMASNHNMDSMKMDKKEMSDEKTNKMESDDEKMKKMSGEESSKIAAMANFPNRGLYKIFAQFKRKDKISTVSFVFEVK